MKQNIVGTSELKYAWNEEKWGENPEREASFNFKKSLCRSDSRRILRIQFLSPMLGNQLNSMGHNHHSHKCTFIEKHGNMEVGIERMGEMGHE